MIMNQARMQRMTGAFALASVVLWLGIFPLFMVGDPAVSLYDGAAAAQELLEPFEGHRSSLFCERLFKAARCLLAGIVNIRPGDNLAIMLDRFVPLSAQVERLPGS